MKKLTTCLLLALCLYAKIAVAVEVPVAFKKAFAEHQQNGTLFDYRTVGDFSERGWGRFYQAGVASDFKGASVDKLRLVIAPAKGNALQTGDKLALVFRLFNDSEQDVSVWVSGTCKTVHVATYMVIDSHGQLLQNIGRGKVGGSHCFCQQTEAVLWSHSARWLDTETDSDSVVGWVPDNPGKYVVIGIYARPSKGDPERKILSKPIVLNVKMGK